MIYHIVKAAIIQVLYLFLIGKLPTMCTVMAGSGCAGRRAVFCGSPPEEIQHKKKLSVVNE